MSLNEGLNDGKTEPRTAATCRIGFAFVKYLGKKILGNSRSRVAHPALDASICTKLPCPDNDPAAWRVRNCVGNEVLKDTLKETCICEHPEIIGYLVDQLCTGGLRDWPQFLDQTFDKGPQIKLSAHEFDSALSSYVDTFLEDLSDQPLQLLHIAAQ